MPNDFGQQLRTFANKAKRRIDLTCAEAIRGVATSLVDKSPVGDRWLWADPWKAPKDYEGGRFKANWNGSVGSPDYSYSDDIDPSGEVSLTNIFGNIPENAGSTFYITNGLPYAQRLEDGWSSQAPSGMVGLTMLEWEGIVDEAVLKVKVAG